MSHRIFFYPDRKNYVLIHESTLAHMYGYAQRCLRHREAGGEVFSRDIDSHGLILDMACGPHPKDKRTRNAYVPDPESATQARLEQYEADLHAVGLWHTHPEPSPTPSHRDQQTTHQYLQAFGPDRLRYLMIIVGNRGNPPNVTVWSAGKKVWGRWVKLDEDPSQI